MDQNKLFRKQEQQASADISKILNPNNEYKRKQEEIINKIFWREKDG